MSFVRSRAHRRSSMGLGTLAVLALGCAPATTGSTSGGAQSTAAAPLVFDGVTVVDVEEGKLVPNQRVVIAGNRIQTVGAAATVTMPKGAHVVKSRGRYLIPGLWDMHHHTDTPLSYLLLVANGITGMRDAGSGIPIEDFARWRREILAGTRVGPPRQILSGRYIIEGCTGLTEHGACIPKNDTAAARRMVDSLKAAGVEMVKMQGIRSREVYLAAAAAARRVGLPFGGHVQPALDPIEAAEIGIDMVEHSFGLGEPCTLPLPSGQVAVGTVEGCGRIAERLRQNGAWWSPTCIGVAPCGGKAAYARFIELMDRFIAFSAVNPFAPDGSGRSPLRTAPDSTNIMRMRLPEQVGMPILTGSDVNGVWPPVNKQVTGFALHGEMAIDVSEGLSPLTVLRGATINPAKFLHATDSLGTVAAGKLADLVLLDGDPLSDITNTTLIRGVVANGRYFDRSSLDGMLKEFQATVKGKP